MEQAYVSMLPIQSALFMAPTPPAESPVRRTCVALAKPCCWNRSSITAAAIRFPRNCHSSSPDSSPGVSGDYRHAHCAWHH